MKFLSQDNRPRNESRKSSTVGDAWFPVVGVIQQYVRYRCSNSNRGGLGSALFICLVFIFALTSQQVLAQSIKLTIYDDGRSCPANCDAHVVFHRSLNGTTFAHDPSRSSAPFKKCAVDTPCQICFDNYSTSCMTVMYRGNGPHANTFDFTPKFYEDNCPNLAIPDQLKQQCKSLKAAANALEGRTNCITDPSNPKCVALMKTANSLQAADQPLYDLCIRDGETAFNRGRPIAQQRSNDCAYEKKGTGGPNRRGATWKRLLPGACRTGTFVGRDGLDCCNGHPFTDGPLGIECKGFYQ